jgi:hypothetical protein
MVVIRRRNCFLGEQELFNEAYLNLLALAETSPSTPLLLRSLNLTLQSVSSNVWALIE